jgi:hypothetical protein
LTPAHKRRKSDLEIFRDLAARVRPLVSEFCADHEIFNAFIGGEFGEILT